MLERLPWSKRMNDRHDLGGFTRFGKTLCAIKDWLQYQQSEAYQALRVTKPKNANAGDFRASDLLEIMSKNMVEYEEIARVALALKADINTVLPRDPAGSWEERYLSEREAHA